MRRLHNKPIARQQQAGVVLILVAFLLALTFSLYALKSLNSQDLTVLKQQKTTQALKSAKDALIAWAVAHPNHPGQMPFPDRNTDLNYDGFADCNSPTSTFNYGFLIGVLPVNGQLNPCEQPQDLALASGLLDADGQVLWYAVSRNLVHKYETSAPCNAAFYTCQASQTGDPVINPQSANSPPYPWMRVLDRNGNVISNRVAAVIIAPGLPLSNQNRTSVAPAPNQFLDNFSIGGIVFSNADYDTANEDFEMGQDSSRVSQNDNTYVRPYLFNDQLIYITIDELMPLVTQRAASEISGLLRTYQVSKGQFPFAANLGQALHNHYGNSPNQSGMLPIDVTDTCSCASASSCSCSFGLVQSIELRRGGSSTWSTALDTGACSSAVTAGRQVCRCNGAGSCNRFATSFTCDATGNCGHSGLTGTNTFTFTTQPHMEVFSLPNGARCLPWPVPTAPPTPPACNTVSLNVAGNFTVGLREVYWFKENLWQDYFYYQWAVTPTLQVGGKTGVSAVLIGAGHAIASPPYATKYIPVSPYVAPTGVQIRPPANATPSLSDYLDSAENTDNDFVFDGLNKPLSNTYNDLPFIVAP